MNWIAVAFLEPIFYALANILDSNLTNRVFRSAWALSIFVAVGNALFVPALWLIDRPQAIPVYMLPYIALVAFIELFYGYPYYKALQNDDTSVAISLFSFGKIFVPLFAFFALGETLFPIQYFGFFLIVVSSAALTFDPKANIKFNVSFLYMLLSSFLLSIEIVAYRFIFDQIDWSTGFFWVTLISALIGLMSSCVPRIGHNLKKELPALKKHYRLILLVGVTGFLGSVGLSYAVSEVSATVSRSIGSFQPFFVLLYAVAFHRYFPDAFKEKVDRRNIFKKAVLFAVTTVGVILTIW